jgi:hypothetical protein
VSPRSQSVHVRLRHSGKLAGILILHTTWNCRGPVALDLLKVVLHDVRKDAVHLGPGCTGTIRRLEIEGDGASLGPGGDGVKIHAGAHDLQVLGGYIDCGRRRPKKHQDAIQAMGGRNVVFHGISSRGCANSFMFVNTGRGHRAIPDTIRCESCRASTNNYSIFVGSSIASGAVGGVFESRVGPRASATAVAPVLTGNVWTARAGGRRRVRGG